MRYISAEILRLNDTPPVSLLADASKGHLVLFELTNPDLEDDSGEVRVRKEGLAIRRAKCLGDDYTETITVQNCINDPADFTLRLHYEADFADMCFVRGMHRGKRGKLHAATVARFGPDLCVMTVRISTSAPRACTSATRPTSIAAAT